MSYSVNNDTESRNRVCVFSSCAYMHRIRTIKKWKNQWIPGSKMSKSVKNNSSKQKCCICSLTFWKRDIFASRRALPRVRRDARKTIASGVDRTSYIYRVWVGCGVCPPTLLRATAYAPYHTIPYHNRYLTTRACSCRPTPTRRVAEQPCFGVHAMSRTFINMEWLKYSSSSMLKRIGRTVVLTLSTSKGFHPTVLLVQFVSRISCVKLSSTQVNVVYIDFSKAYDIISHCSSVYIFRFRGPLFCFI